MLFQFFSYAYSVLFKFFFCSFVFSSVGINWDLLHAKWVLDQAAATSFPWLINSGVGAQWPIFGQPLLNSLPFCLHILQYVLYICLVLEYIRPCSLLRQENPEDTPHISFSEAPTYSRDSWVLHHHSAQCSVTALYHQPSLYYFFPWDRISLSCVD